MKASHTKRQFTPTYHRLWNRDFATLIIAELLLCVSCYMTIPFITYQPLMGNLSSIATCSMAMVTFVVGIFLSGFFCSWLIQRYRRNRVFCISTICLSGGIVGMYLLYKPIVNSTIILNTLPLLGTCLICGILFGNSKRILSCTLLIDKTESCHRTEANYTAIWIARLAVIVGPMLALLLKSQMQGLTYHLVAATSTLVATILVMSVKFPFRAPEEGLHLLSFDRFILLDGWNIACVIALMAAALGIVLTTRLSVDFCMATMCGLALAVVTLRFPEIRSGRYTSTIGNICILTTMVAMVFHNGLLDDTLKPMLLGLGYGLTSSEQLYKLLECCNHCQRSTAESTYFMSSDGGLFLGIAVGMQLTSGTRMPEYIALILFVLAVLVCTINALKKKKPIAYHA